MIIVYDLDGTLRDTRPADDVVPTDPTKQENWQAWQRRVNAVGTPIVTNCNSYRADTAMSGDDVWIVTNSSFGTREWLIDNALPLPDKIVQRGTADHRHPTQLKKDFLETHALEISVWIDDSDEVCAFIKKQYPAIKVIKVTHPNELGAKFDQEKPMYNLLPPVAIDYMAQVMTFGAKKYAPNSWQEVPNGEERYRAALLRHAFAIQTGELYDSETGLPHAAHAMCCAAFIAELQEEKRHEE